MTLDHPPECDCGERWLHTLLAAQLKKQARATERAHMAERRRIGKTIGNAQRLARARRSCCG